MRMVQGTRYLQRIAGSALYLDRATVAQLVAQGSAPDVLHYQVGNMATFTKIIDGDDIGMLELCNHLRLLLEARLETGLASDLREDYLDGYIAPQPSMVGLVNPRHATFTQPG